MNRLCRLGQLSSHRLLKLGPRNPVVPHGLDVLTAGRDLLLLELQQLEGPDEHIVKMAMRRAHDLFPQGNQLVSISLYRANWLDLKLVLTSTKLKFVIFGYLISMTYQIVVIMDHRNAKNLLKNMILNTFLYYLTIIKLPLTISLIF